MLKEAFLKGFIKRIARMSDDAHAIAKGVERGKITHDLSSGTKELIRKEISGIKEDIAKEIKTAIKPSHLLGAGVAAGASMGIGKGIIDNVTGSTQDRRPREVHSGEGLSNPYGQGRIGLHKEYR